VSRTGRPEIATDPMGVEISDTYLILNDRATWRFETKEALIAAIDETLKARIPGAIYSYSQPIELRIAELISGVRSDVAINVYGDDIDRMHQVAEAIVAVVGRIAGAADAKAEQTTGLPVLRIRLDHAAMARYGLAADDVLDVVETLGGKVVGTVIEGQKRFALQVRFDASVRDLDRVRDLAIPLPASATGRPRLVALAQVATLDIVDGPAQISRENISRRTSVEVNVRGRDLAGFVAEAQAAVAKEVALPPGWVLEWGGQFENLQAASQRLVVLLPLALGVIFVLLYSAFASGRLALLIYLNVPLALSGGLLALAARGYPFSISAGVGFIALFGVAVLNGVVLVSYIVDRQIQGMAPAAAAVEGAKVRLRPVLMTGLVASLGFLPMALATSAGAEVQRPLATVVIGGLLTSTLLTLLVLPAVYRWFVPGETPESEAP